MLHRGEPRPPMDGEPPWPAPLGVDPVAPAQPNREFAGRFVILDEIGIGGTGRVWRARQKDLGREIALKTSRLGNLGPAGDELRLRREAQVVARLRHPGIVALYEAGEAEGIPFLVMELVRGESLAQRLRAGPLPATHAAMLVRDLAEAVTHAHQARIIHRDLKPSNILLDAERGGSPRLTDFGIARILEDPQQLTATGEGLGTASYLAPEQASLQRDQEGPATDVYGLGAVLFHCLTGRAPFVGDSAAAVVRAVIDEEPPAPRTLNPTIPRDLNTLCLRALKKDPRRRYRSAAALRDDLDRFLRHQPILARPVGVVERAWRWAWRHPELSAALTLALGLLTALAWVRERNQHQLSHTVTQLELQRAAVLFRDG
jgi:serine/threonine protein kinase